MADPEDPPIRRVGARYPSAALQRKWRDESPDPAKPAGTARPTQLFREVRRGYDRDQVDDYVDGLRAELDGLRRRLADADRERRDAEHRADAAEADLRRTAEQQRLRPPDNAGEGSGYLTDRMARLARRDAAEIRAEAVRAARELLDLARAEAEAIRNGR